MSSIIDRILTEVCLDERVQDGVFDMSNNDHMAALLESLTDKFSVSLNDAKSIHNKMVEGKYPERQAYNKDGLLVTFPTPQHKAKAIQRGTHFEQDPAKGPQNVFGGGNAPQAGQQPPATGGQPPAGGAPQAPTQNVFPQEPQGQTPQSPQGQAPTQGEPSQLPASEAPPTPSPAATPSAGSALPPSDSLPQQSSDSDKQSLAVEPQSGAATPPPPTFDTVKKPEERAAEATVVKQMLGGNTNDPTLSPTMPLNVTEQLAALYRYAQQHGYTGAMQIVSEAMNTTK